MEIGTLIAIGITQGIAFVVWVVRMSNKVTILETQLQGLEKQFTEYKADQHLAMGEIKNMFGELQKSIDANFKEIRKDIHEIDKKN